MLETPLTQQLGIQYPIIQAPMGGSNATTPELVAAVSEARGLGSLGAGYMSAEAIRDAVIRIRTLTNQPFAVNLFVPSRFEVDGEAVLKMNERLDVFRQELGIPQSPSVTKYEESFEEQVDVLLELGVPVCSFTFGIPPAWVMDKLREQGTYLMGTATTVKEAILLEQAGSHAVVAQGGEAGGHRGSFTDTGRKSPVGTMALVPQVVDHVSIPVVAAGGIMDGRGLAASLMLGAAGVQMGTAFLTSQESGVSEAYKEAVMRATEDQTAITTVYSGKEARGVETDFMRQMSSYPGVIPPYPVQNALTMDIRRAATAEGNVELMSLWAGQGLRLTTSRSASQIVQDTVEQAYKLIQRRQIRDYS